MCRGAGVSIGVCENFLYRFKAAPRAARAADTAGPAELPLVTSGYWSASTASRQFRLCSARRWK